MSAIGRVPAGDCAVAGFESAHDTDEKPGAAYDSPLHKKRASPPSPRGPGHRRTPFGIRGGLGVRAPGGHPRAPTPPPAGQAGSGVGAEGEPQAELQRLRLALAAAEEQNAALTARVDELTAALAASRTSGAQQQDHVTSHIEELDTIQLRCEGSWAPLDFDEEENLSVPAAEPEAAPPPQRQGTRTLRGAPKLQLSLLNDDHDDCDAEDDNTFCLSPRTRGAIIPPWSPRTQGAEVALPSSPRTLAAALALPSVDCLAAEVPLPDTPRSQGTLSSPRPGGAGGGCAASEAGSSLATAWASPPESPRLGAAEAEPPRGVGAVAAAVRWLWGLLRR